MRRSRRSERACRLLVLTTVLAGAAGVSAHRRDEYLQAARIGIDPAAVQLQLDMTPGIGLADAVLAEIDRDRDGSLSAAEQRAYGSLVSTALELDIDGTRLQLQPGAMSFPEIDSVKRGEGTLRLHFAATLPRLSAGAHQLTFRNRHQRSRSVYLANALVPRSYQVTIAAQRRDADQTELRIDYVLRAAPAGPVGAWLLAGLMAATVLSAALLGRPFRSLH